MTTNKIKLSEHFCPCCKTVRLVPLLLKKLQRLRDLWQKPIVLTSGYRCQAHNAAVGGAPRSKHRTGRAADVRIPAQEQPAFQALAMLCSFTKIILYEDRNFVHLET